MMPWSIVRDITLACANLLSFVPNHELLDREYPAFQRMLSERSEEAKH